MEPLKELPKPILAIGCLGILLIILSSIYYASPIKPSWSFNEPKESVINTTTQPSILVNKVLTINGCNIEQSGNPLVAGVHIIKGDIIGILQGKINKVIFTKKVDSTSSAALQLVSLKGKQTYDFQVSARKGLIYDTAVSKEINLDDLKQGQTATVYLSCSPEQNRLLKVVQIVVMD